MKISFSEISQRQFFSKEDTSGTSSSVEQGERGRQVKVEVTLLDQERRDNGLPTESTPNTRKDSLRVLSLNIAHGRGERAHQLFLGEATIRHNLLEIAELLRRENIDLAGLQECDISSFWNGQFNHLEYIQKELSPSLPFGACAAHMKAPRLSYGTSIISCLPLREVEGFRFAERLPLPRKGFIAARLSWPDNSAFQFLFCSVHLDFLRLEQRMQQVKQLSMFLKEHNLPIIVVGDFNCGWNDSNSALRQLARECELHTYKPELETSTFRFRAVRWDWVMASEHFAITQHSVLSDRLSDHKPVVVEIIRRQ